MTDELPVHKTRITVNSEDYEVLVFIRPDGTHVARTALGINDVVINDGSTLEVVMEKHCALLPLAVESRELLASGRSD